MTPHPLESFPRVTLGHWPTPLHPCERLREHIGGPLVWLKRDDCSGLAFGGNKTRKLEFLLGHARQRDATGIVTFGALQSNHARQTAAACARLGVPCELVLVESVDRETVHYRASGNRLLDDILGASVHVVADDEAALVRAAELLEADLGRYVIDPGGSSPVGALGYVAAAHELAGQLRSSAIEPSRVVVAASTGGTAAGLVVGFAQAGVDTIVHASAVYGDAVRTRHAIETLISSTIELLGGARPADARLVVSDRGLGAGYGIETPESHAALETLARTEGVLLDPVYTAKAFGELLAGIDDASSGSDGVDEHLVFVHTGGQPGIFAYADAFDRT